MRGALIGAEPELCSEHSAALVTPAIFCLGWMRRLLGRNKCLLKMEQLFDHFVGTGEQRGRNFEAQIPRRFQIDD